MTEHPLSRFRRIRVEQLDEWVLVEFFDTIILDEQNVQFIGEELFSLVETNPRVVLNFAAVEFLSSAMLGKLITFQKRIGEADGRLILCGVSDKILEVFKITRLNKCMHISPTVSEALPMLASRDVGVACPWDGCGHQIVLPLVAFIDAAYHVRCPACETGLKLSLADGLESDRAWVSSMTVPTFEEQFLHVFASRKGDRKPTGPFVVHLKDVCELYVADAIERIVRTLPAPRQIIFNVAQLKELTRRAADRMQAVAESLEPGEVLVALYKKSDDPPPFEWPVAIPLCAESKQAHDACAVAGPPVPLVVALDHF